MTALFLCGHVLDKLAGLPSDFFSCVVTSPPYYGLRKYGGEQELTWGGDKKCEHEWSSVATKEANASGGQNSPKQNTVRGSHFANYNNRVRTSNVCSLCGAWKGAFGLEPSPSLYVQHSVEILSAIRRVLRPDGVVWWNIGDSYAGSGNGSGDYRPVGSSISKNNAKYQGQKPGLPSGLKPGDMCLIPQRLAIALQEDGWWVRSWIVWDKTNAMPASVNGYRWERHKVTVKGRGASTAGVDKYEEMGEGNPHASRDGYESERHDCPGCPKCSPNDGLVLRKGSWRPTTAHEYILMLVKSEDYYCDKEAVTEPVAQSSIERAKYPFHTAFVEGRAVNSRPNGSMAQFVPQAAPLSYNTKYDGDGVTTGLTPQGFSRNKTIEWGRAQSRVDAVLMFPDDPEAQQKYINFIHNHHAVGGRNLRSVWTFPTQPLPSRYKHFAAYPEKLPETCIKASTPEVGVCPNCGAPWARVIDRATDDSVRATADSDAGIAFLGRPPKGFAGVPMGNSLSETPGWRPTCSCYPSNSIPASVPARVLDPFSGSGTTALVCEKLGRDFIGIDISSDYIAIARARLLAAKLKHPPKSATIDSLIDGVL